MKSDIIPPRLRQKGGSRQVLMNNRAYQAFQTGYQEPSKGRTIHGGWVQPFPFPQSSGLA